MHGEEHNYWFAVYTLRDIALHTTRVGLRLATVSLLDRMLMQYSGWKNCNDITKELNKYQESRKFGCFKIKPCNPKIRNQQILYISSPYNRTCNRTLIRIRTPTLSGIFVKSIANLLQNSIKLYFIWYFNPALIKWGLADPKDSKLSTTF